MKVVYQCTTCGETGTFICDDEEQANEAIGTSMKHCSKTMCHGERKIIHISEGEKND